MNITIGSTTTTDRLDIVYILFNSIKQTKQQDTNITYYLFVKYTDKHNEEYCQKYFGDLISPDFNIIFKDVDVFKDKVHTPARDHLYYAKCLFPTYFTNLDKILFLDVDLIFIKPGIEQLWSINIDNFYVGAVVDPVWSFSPKMRSEIINTLSKNYFNAGVILMNLKQIREDKKDQQLEYWCSNWDTNKLICYCYDQTLINYILKDKVLLLNFRFNNTLLASSSLSQHIYPFYLHLCKYDDFFKSLDDAIIVHFAGANKPWSQRALESKDYLYKNSALQLWKQVKQILSKQEEI